MNLKNSDAADAAETGAGNRAVTSAESWDTYWRGSSESGAWTDEGSRHPAVLEFWSDFFATVGAAREKLVLADLASGNGAVVECAMNALGPDRLEVTCIDLSAAAVENISQRFPGVNGLVCDARSIPLDAQTFDAVTSQFGVEYGGPEAVTEAARLLADGGTLGLLLHHRGGAIARECAASLDAIERARASGFVPRTIDMFKAGFAAVRGADRAPYDDAAAQLAPALSAVEGIMAEHGEQVASSTISRLYADVRRIHERLPHYDPDEVLTWLDRMDQELDAYGRRMASMLESALDENGFRELCEMLQSAGCTVRQGGPMNARSLDEPIGWAVIATRDAARNDRLEGGHGR